MPKVDVVDLNNQKVGEIELADQVFGAEINDALLYEAVRHYQAGQRAGTHKTKTRSEVAGAGKKLWKQKGTGRARAGKASSPLWRGGGKIFPNSPDENFSHKVNRKAYRAGISAILSQLAREGRLSVVESFAQTQPKTKVLAQKLKDMGLASVLVITDSVDENLYLSSRNLPNVLVIEPKNADPLSLLKFEKTLLTRGAVAKFEEMLA